MEKVNKIINHPKWRNYVFQLNELEKDRIYCKHDFEHFISLARIAYIENLEKGYNLSKEFIYATALLHDIGRIQEYLDGTPHEVASGQMAKEILEDCDFSLEEQDKIIDAIVNHRQSSNQSNRLSEVIYQADKKSRNCFMCEAIDSCHWKEEKKNKKIKQ